MLRSGMHFTQVMHPGIKECMLLDLATNSRALCNAWCTLRCTVYCDSFLFASEIPALGCIMTCLARWKWSVAIHRHRDAHGLCSGFFLFLLPLTPNCSTLIRVSSSLGSPPPHCYLNY